MYYDGYISLCIVAKLLVEVRLCISLEDTHNKHTYARSEACGQASEHSDGSHTHRVCISSRQQIMVLRSAALTWEENKSVAECVSEHKEVTGKTGKKDDIVSCKSCVPIIKCKCLYDNNAKSKLFIQMKSFISDLMLCCFLNCFLRSGIVFQHLQQISLMNRIESIY